MTPRGDGRVSKVVALNTHCERRETKQVLCAELLHLNSQRKSGEATHAERHGHHADAYKFIEPIKDRLFPKDFEYTHINPEDGVETTTTQALFGDLIAAVEQTIDGEGATAAASNPLRGASFAPGTHAQRHRVRQSGSKHGGARRVFSRPLTPLVTKFLGSSSSAD